MRQLDVYMNDTKAGVLSESFPGHDYTFLYDKDFLATSLPPISITLPKRAEAYQSEHLFPFFTNMLPEGANRREICRYFRLDGNDFFGMLTVLADQDFIGAVEVRKQRNENDQH